MPRGRVRPCDVAVPAAYGLGAVLAMTLVAVVGLLSLGVPMPGATGVAAAALAVAAAGGGCGTVSLDVALGRLDLALPGQVRAVPVVVTLTGALVLAAGSRAALRRRPTPPDGVVLAVRALVAALTAAAAVGAVATWARLDVVVPGRTPSSLHVSARPGEAVTGILLLSLGVHLVSGWPGRDPARVHGWGASRVPWPAIGAVSLVASIAALVGAPWRAFGRVAAVVLALPNLATHVVARSAGVPWTVRVPDGRGAAGLPAGGADGPGAALGSASTPGSPSAGLAALAQGPPAWVRVVLVLVVVGIAAARGVVLGRRARRPAGTSLVGYALTGAGTLCVAAWLTSLSLELSLPFGAGASLAVSSGGDPVVAAVLGAGWGALLGLVVRLSARWAAGRAPAGEPRHTLGSRWEAPSESAPGRAGVADGRRPGADG